MVANVEHCLQLFWLLKGSGTTAFAFSFLNGQLPGHEEAVPSPLCGYIYSYMYTCRPMSSRPWTASEFDKVGRGKFKNSQGLCHHGL